MASSKTLKTGEILSEQQFYKVSKIKGNQVELRTDDGSPIVVDSKYVDQHLTSATQYTSSKKVNKTEAATLFLGSGGTAMTVNFNKQVKTADVVDEIMDLISRNKGIVSKADITRSINRGLEGEERTMIGRHYGQVNELGRVSFIDMEVQNDPKAAFDARLRQVDPRTINYLIIKGVKYDVK